MSYIELGNTYFRGRLEGATGVFAGTLRADKINAVDTINIARGAVTYSKIVRYQGKSVTAGQTMLEIAAEIPDDGAYVEITAQAHLGGTVTINGQARINRNFRSSSSLIFPFVETVPLAKGTHIIRLAASSTGLSSFGVLTCRYIRKTGRFNT